MFKFKFPSGFSLVFLSALAIMGGSTYLIAADVSKPHTFAAGEVISATQMNANFDALYTELNAKDDRLDAIEADGWVTSARIASGATMKVEAASRTINLAHTMTHTQLQAAIDGVGKYIAKDVIITFQFANGTYSYTSPIAFRGFVGEGSVLIAGDTTQGVSAHTNQNVVIDFTAADSNVLEISHNTVPVNVRNLKLTLASSGSKHGLVATGNTYLDVRASYILGPATSGGNRAYYALGGGVAYVQTTVFSNLHYAIVCALGATLISSSNASTGTNPNVGLWALAAGTIVKLDATQPSAGTAESSLSGGVIR